MINDFKQCQIRTHKNATCCLNECLNKKGTQKAPVSDRGAVFCALSSVGTKSISQCKRGKFNCLIDIGNNKEMKYAKGTWNIIIVNVDLNTVSIISQKSEGKLEDILVGEEDGIL